MRLSGGAAAARAVLAQAAAVVFDFDGTLVDSNEIKWRAFDTVFAGFPDRLPEISAYCRAHNHTPRDVKFRHVYETMLGVPYTPDVARRIENRFEAETTSAIIAAPEIPGASACLAALAAQLRLGLLSSTPDAILRQIVRARGWEDRFAWVQGAPVNKREWLDALSRRVGAAPRSIVFCGDTPEDHEAAAAAGCSFVGVRNRALADAAAYWIEDFTCLM